jgi:hypothetical protein
VVVTTIAAVTTIADAITIATATGGRSTNSRTPTATSVGRPAGSRAITRTVVGTSTGVGAEAFGSTSKALDPDRCGPACSHR